MPALSMDKKRELRIFLSILVKTVWVVGLVAILGSCGTSPGYSYTISGTVSGMVGSGMVLQNNGGDDRTISVNGAFAFDTALTSGTAYSVTVETQPTSPSQTCIVSNGVGTINGSPVYNVAVSCVMNSSPVTVDPFGLFAYVSNSSPGDISAYAISSTDGSLSPSYPGNRTAAAPGSYPSQVTVDPSGNFAYVANIGFGTVSAYTIDQTTSITPGALTTVGSFAAGTSPVSVTIYPYTPPIFASSGEFAYVPNMGDGTVSAYTINQTTGALTAVTGSPFTAGTSPTSVTVDPSGKFVYVPNMTDSTISAYSISPTDGSLTALLDSPFLAGTYPTSFTVYANLSGEFAYVPNMGSSNISVYTISPTDGSLSTGTTVTAGTYPMSVTVYANSSGGAFAYVSNMGSSNISVYTINSDGSLSPSPGTIVPAGTYPNPVTIYTAPSWNFACAYVSNRGDDTISTYTIGSSGALTPGTTANCGVGVTLPTGTSPTTVTIDPKGPYAYVSSSNTGAVSAFTIDSNTGALALIP